MKVNIVTKLKSGAWGGANQFLKALKKEFEKRGEYTNNISEAEIVLLNSYQDIGRALKLKYKYPNKIFVHRLGPIFKLHRNKYWGLIDKYVIAAANYVSSGIVFQSNWSRDQSIELGFAGSKPNVVIGNAPNPDIFYPQVKTTNGKIKLLAVSWSNNPKKGGEYYEYLDKSLDFNKYEMTFIGQFDREFDNLKKIGVLDSPTLADKIREHDIFISAARDEAFSNAIAEALFSGLPVVAIASGSNQEVVGEGGEFFREKNELLEKIDKVAVDLELYRSKIKVRGIKEVASAYRVFFESLSVKRVSRARLTLMYFKIIMASKLVKILDKIC